jgi:hypothetical protein
MKEGLLNHPVVRVSCALMSLSLYLPAKHLKAKILEPEGMPNTIPDKQNEYIT